jgi:hypothetical protein
MRELTQNESKLLTRYLKLTALHDRYAMFKRAREASNALLDSVEAAIPKTDPTTYQLTYLQGISRRKSKNYRKLQGMNHLLRVTEALRQKTLAELGIGRRP